MLVYSIYSNILCTMELHFLNVILDAFSWGIGEPWWSSGSAGLPCQWSVFDSLSGLFLRCKKFSLQSIQVFTLATLVWFCRIDVSASRPLSPERSKYTNTNSLIVLERYLIVTCVSLHKIERRTLPDCSGIYKLSSFTNKIFV